MSTMEESPIREMPPWRFWAHFDSVDMPPDIVEALKAGVATPIQRATADLILARAKSALIHAVPGVARPS